MDRTTNITLGIQIDKKTAQQAGTEVRNFFQTLARERVSFVRDMARLETTLTREEVKQDEIRAKSAQKTLDEQTRARERQVNSSKRLIDQRAKYEYESGQKSVRDYINHLRDEEKAEEASYGRRSRLRREREKLEAGPRPTALSLAGNAAGAIASAVTIRETIGYINKVTGYASDLNETLNKTRIIFGASAVDMEAWAKGATKNLGATRQEALEYGSTLANQFRVASGEMSKLGMSLSETTQNLSQRAADVASFNNAAGGTPQVLEAIQSGLNGESQPLRQFGVFLNEARVKAEAFATGLAEPVKNAKQIEQAHKAVEIAVFKLTEQQKKYGEGSVEVAAAQLTLDKANGRLEKALSGSRTELTEGQKMLARYQLILKDTNVAAGDYVRTSGDLANKQRTVNAEIKELETQLGEKLLPLKKQVLEFLSGMLDGFNKLDKSTQSWITTLGGIGLIVAPFAVAVTGLVANILRIKAAYQEVALAQAGVGLSGGAGGVVGAGAKAGLLPAVGGALISSAPVTVPAGIATYFVKQAAEDDIRVNDARMKDIYGSNDTRLKTLYGQKTGLQKQIDALKVASSTTNGQGNEYMAAMQAEPPGVAPIRTQIQTIDSEIKILEREQAKAKTRTALTSIVRTTAGTILSGIEAPGSGTGTGAGAGGLYSGKDLQKASRQADAIAKREAEFVAKANADAAQYTNQLAQDGVETAFRIAKASLEKIGDEGERLLQNDTLGNRSTYRESAMKRIDETVKKLREASVQIFNAEAKKITDEYQAEAKAQPDDTPLMAQTRDRVAMAKANQRLLKANADEEARQGDITTSKTKAQGEVGQVYRRGLTRTNRQYHDSLSQTIEATSNHIAGELRQNELALSRAVESGDVNEQERLIKERLKLKRELAGAEFFFDPDGFKAAWDEASYEATQAMNVLAEKRGTVIDLTQMTADAPATGPGAYDVGPNAPSDPTARGANRYYQDPETGYWYDRKTSGPGGTGQARVDPTAVNALGRSIGAVSDASRDGLRGLFAGDGGKSFEELPKKLGRDFGEIAADTLHEKLIQGPLDKWFDKIGDKLAGNLKIGGKDAGQYIAGAALALGSILTLSGKQGKKKQQGGFLGAALGVAIGSMIPGGSLLGDIGIGSLVGGELFSFASGGRPPLNQPVRVAEQGTELAIFDSGRAAFLGAMGEQRPQIASFGESATIYTADQTRAMLAGSNDGAGQGGTTLHIGSLMTVGTIYDRTDANFIMGAFSDVLQEITTFDRH